MNHVPLLTPAEVARLLAVRPATIYAAAARGALPCIRVWRGERRTLLRFRDEDIQRILRERTEPSPPEKAGGQAS